MNGVPVSAILAVFHQGQVETAKLFSNIPEPSIITAVTAVVYLPIWSDEGKGSWEGLVSFEHPSGEMAGRKHPYGKAIQLHLFIPVSFMDFGQGIAPFFVVSPIAKARHHILYLRLYFLHEIIVQMIPVVMGQHHDVQIIGNVVRTVHIASLKGPGNEWNRRGVPGRYGINQYFLSAYLHIKGRMPHPHHHVFIPGNRFQVRLFMPHRFLRNIDAGGGEKEGLPEGHIRLHLFMGHVRPEFPVPVMGRRFYAGPSFRCHQRVHLVPVDEPKARQQEAGRPQSCDFEQRKHNFSFYRTI